MEAVDAQGRKRAEGSPENKAISKFFTRLDAISLHEKPGSWTFETEKVRNEIAISLKFPTFPHLILVSDYQTFTSYFRSIVFKRQ